jgi:23S rRNA (uracil1939-C5)-methyltransferase
VLATTRIESIAAGGAGVTRVDGLVVFTPRTAPGDLAELSYVKRDRLGHGRLVRLVESSPDRVAPRCRHYDGNRCGGCQLQHLALEAQHEAKRRIVADAMLRIARRDVEVPPVIASPAAWAYRNKLTLALRREGGRWRAGLHQWDNVDRVFSLEECPITHPRVVEGWHAILAGESLLPRATELRGAVRLAGDALAFVLEGADSWPRARDFAARLSGFSAVRWIDLAGTHHDVLDVAQERPAASFEQVNPALAERLRADVVTLVRAFAPATVIDAYAGAGDTALALAEHGIRVCAIELDREAVQHAARRLPPPSEAIGARVEDVLASRLPADVVVVNPPRAGVDARVCATLESPPPGVARPRAVVYVSCNPATLARDLGRLPSYRLQQLQPYDMFPQTAHVETVCLLVPEP